MSVVSSRSVLGNAVKAAKGRGQEPKNDQAVLEARRRLAEVKIAEFVARVVANAPPLTSEQVDRLRELFRASPSARAGDDPSPARQASPSHPGGTKRGDSG